jgi:hypothetical protein
MGRSKSATDVDHYSTLISFDAQSEELPPQTTDMDLIIATVGAIALLLCVGIIIYRKKG